MARWSLRVRDSDMADLAWKQDRVVGKLQARSFRQQQIEIWNVVVPFQEDRNVPTKACQSPLHQLDHGFDHVGSVSIDGQVTEALVACDMELIDPIHYLGQ